jgi:hypothetical protein
MDASYERQSGPGWAASHDSATAREFRVEGDGRTGVTVCDGPAGRRVMAGHAYRVTDGGQRPQWAGPTQ